MAGAAGFTFAIAAGPELLALAAGEARAAAAKDVRMSAWVTLATDGTVTIMSPAAEMGHGSVTSLPLILAEELDVEWAQEKVVPAPADEKTYGNPGFGGLMYTAGSFSVNGYFNALRTFGAQVRHVLCENAARRWGVPVAETATVPGSVVHLPSGRRLSYGEIAVFAQVPAQAPSVERPPLKPAGGFRLIGRDVGASGIALSIALTQLQTLFIAASIPVIVVTPFIMARKLRNADGSCKIDPTR